MFRNCVKISTSLLKYKISLMFGYKQKIIYFRFSDNFSFSLSKYNNLHKNNKNLNTF